MIRILALALALAATVPARAAAYDDNDDWTAFGHILTLVETMVRVGMQPNPDIAMADVLSGHDPKVNGAVAELFAGAAAEMPPEYRDRVASIGREIAGHAARQGATAQIQARKDLTAMGLRYYDEGQFLDAAKRNDTLAVELFVAGRGVNLGAKTWDGRSALDIARANGNPQLAELLSRNLPPAR
jgi:hypothetical protein